MVLLIMLLSGLGTQLSLPHPIAQWLQQHVPVERIPGTITLFTPGAPGKLDLSPQWLARPYHADEDQPTLVRRPYTPGVDQPVWLGGPYTPSLQGEQAVFGVP